MVQPQELLDPSELPPARYALFIAGAEEIRTYHGNRILFVTFEILEDPDLAGREIRVALSLSQKALLYTNDFFRATGYGAVDRKGLGFPVGCETLLGRTVQADVYTHKQYDDNEHITYKEYFRCRNWAAWSPPWETERSR